MDLLEVPKGIRARPNNPPPTAPYADIVRMTLTLGDISRAEEERGKNNTNSTIAALLIQVNPIRIG